jgi:DNA-binding transcriptional MerR regulator
MMATYRRTVKATFDEEQGVFMISVAAELAEMHPQTLRMYEQRGLIAPKRSPKNTRLYSQRDVERLRRIQQMTAEGLNLAGVETVLALEAQVQKLRAEGERLRKRIAELELNEKNGETGLCRRIGSRRNRAKRWRRRRSWPAPVATRRSPRPTCCWRCSTRPRGWQSRSCRRSAPTRRRRGRRP